MLFLILSIICSVSVGAIFKLTRTYNCNPFQIIAFNYIIAIALCYFIFNPNVGQVTAKAPWNIYLAVCILLPVVFYFLVLSIQHIGIVKTDAAQRLSLFIPILAAWLIFNEDFNLYKIIGLIIGFFALLLILNKPSANTNSKKWIFPAFVLIGFGIIDILFKQIALYTSLPYTTSLFVVFDIALAVSLFILVYQAIVKNIRVEYKNFLFGVLVGIFNFGNILFYLKAHKAFSENPSTVFASMNIGVIVLGTFVGMLFFKEKLSKINFAGIILALTAIVFIVISQL